MNGEYTFEEITTQAEAWADALAAFDRLGPAIDEAHALLQPRQAVFIGCGSTHYLAVTAAHLFQSLTGIPARGLASSEVILFPEGCLPDPGTTLLVPVSRSGTTTETLAAVDLFRERGGRAVWTVTCYPDSPLAQASDLVLPAVVGQEQSVAQTRSFASMLVLCQALAARLGSARWETIRQLPDVGRWYTADVHPLVAELGRMTGFERIYFLGSGPQYGIAAEAMLKMTEMSLTTSQAFHFLEFRHGPMSMVDERTLVVGLLSTAARAQENKVVEEMAERGAAILRLDPAPQLGGSDEGGRAWTIAVPDGWPAWALPVLYLPPLQLLGYYRARAKGLDPDNPRNLTQVIYLDRETLKRH